MVHLITHPFVHDALATLRDASTPPDIFRRVAKRMTLLITADVLKDVVDGGRHGPDAARAGLRPPRRTPR